MLARLLLLFILIPLIELAVLIQLGRLVGLWPTVGLVAATAALGAILARRQGLRAFREIQYELSRGRVPAARMLDGLMILLGAILLLTPGLLTDLTGILLLLPPVRGRLSYALRRRFDRMVKTGQVSMFTLISPPGRP